MYEKRNKHSRGGGGGITALVEYGPSNTAHVKYGPPIDSHYSTV